MNEAELIWFRDEELKRRQREELKRRQRVDETTVIHDNVDAENYMTDVIGRQPRFALLGYLVTVKLPRNPKHDPRNKVTGPCPLGGGDCTDVTGEHHTRLHHAHTIEEAREAFSGYHITRIEAV